MANIDAGELSGSFLPVLALKLMGGDRQLMAQKSLIQPQNFYPTKGRL